MQMIFTKIESIINLITKKLTVAATSNHLLALKTIVSVYIILWVAIRGYMILAGKSDDPIKGLLFDGAVKLIVFNVVFDPNWIKLVTSSIDGLNTWASGGISIYERLDELLNKVMELANKLSNKGDGFLGFHAEGFVSKWIILFFFGVFSIVTALIMIGTTITLKIIIMLSPFMIFSLMFDWFKQIFSRWLEMIIANTLTVLMIGLLLNILNTQYEDIINSANKQMAFGDIFYIAFLMSAASIVLAWVVLMAKGIAQQLASASIEHLPGAAAQETKQLARSIKKLLSRE